MRLITGYLCEIPQSQSSKVLYWSNLVILHFLACEKKCKQDLNGGEKWRVGIYRNADFSRIVFDDYMISPLGIVML